MTNPSVPSVTRNLQWYHWVSFAAATVVMLAFIALAVFTTRTIGDGAYYAATASVIFGWYEYFFKMIRGKGLGEESSKLIANVAIAVFIIGAVTAAVISLGLF
jgi:hypothetical protein